MPPVHRPSTDAARSLVTVGPLLARWIDRLLATHEPPLTSAQYLALRAIADAPVSVSELARSAGVSGPAASQLVTALHGAGLVERRFATEDRRRQDLTLSTLGRRTLRSADRILTARVGELLEGLPHPEADALARALPVVEAALTGRPPPRRPHPPPPRRGVAPRE